MSKKLEASGFTKNKRHYGGPAMIDIDADKATALSYWWVADYSDKPAVFATGTYRDELRRIDGYWKIAHIGAVLLAAGASRRMGVPKQSLPYGTTTLLRRAVEAALASVCHPVVVVLGTHSERITREIEGLPIIVVENLRRADGIGSSISAGVGALCTAAPQVPAVILMLCDQPLVTCSVISRIVEAHQRTRASIVASQYAGSLGVPALFTHAHFAELRALNSTEGAKKMIH